MPKDTYPHDPVAFSILFETPKQGSINAVITCDGRMIPFGAPHQTHLMSHVDSVRNHPGFVAWKTKDFYDWAVDGCKIRYVGQVSDGVFDRTVKCVLVAQAPDFDVLFMSTGRMFVFVHEEDLSKHAKNVCAVETKPGLFDEMEADDFLLEFADRVTSIRVGSDI